MNDWQRKHTHTHTHTPKQPILTRQVWEQAKETKAKALSYLNV